MSYKIVRFKSAGVFAGFVESIDGDVVVMTEARRLWYWSGAASLSQLAVDGVSKPDKCKFPAPVPAIRVREWIEIIDVSAEAQASIAGVPIWRE